MKKIAYIFLPLLTASLMTGCSTDDEVFADGEGKISLAASLSGDVKVVSRADADGLRETYGPTLKLWLTKLGKGPVRTYEGIDEIPSGPVAMQTGNYAAEAWAGDSVPASWGESKYFKGYEPFEISRNATTQVNVVCKIVNTLVSVSYDENVDEVLKDYSLKVSSLTGELTFEGRDDRKGYFMLPTKSKTLTIELTGTGLDGKPYKQTETIEDAQPTTEYCLRVKYDPKNPDAIGGAVFDIVVDPTEIEVDNEIVITLAPEIKGINFDIAQPVTGEQGAIGRRSVYISAADALTDVVIESDEFNAIIGHNDVGLVNESVSKAYLDQLNAAGIRIVKTVSSDGRLTNIRVNFEESFTSTLENGVHTFKFTATDAYDGDAKTAEATLTFNVTDAPVQSLPVEQSAISYTSATLRASIVKPWSAASRAAGEHGFRYRAQDSAAWTYVEGTVSGNMMTATLTGLTDGTTYEYKAVADDFETTVMTFTTMAYPQLPNASFESWQGSAPALIGPFGKDKFWDSGNHGSKTMGKDVTTSDATYKHSGNYSIKLASQFVGVGIMGKFAAGNLFAGEYLKTKGTNGVLGWGRPWTVTPKALKGYVRYEPKAITHRDDNAPDEYVKGEMDKGIIYVALVDNTTKSAEGKNYPCIVKTETKELFSKNDANVLAYGEIIFDTATGGDGMVEFNIPIEKIKDGTVANIIIVASASKGGDYFAGGDGSTMWIDDLKLVY